MLLPLRPESFWKAIRKLFSCGRHNTTLFSFLLSKGRRPLDAAPTITVQFNEPVVIGDVNLFEHLAYWAVNCVACPGGSRFTVTEATLEEGSQTVTLTGKWDTDQLVTGDQVMVHFIYNSLMDIKDRAGNAFSTTVSILTCTVTP